MRGARVRAMTRRRVPYLAQRGGVFQIRLPVPRHLQAVLTRKELQRSIKTSDYKVARRIALRAGSQFADLCASIHPMTDVSSLDVPGLIDRFFAGLIADLKPSDLTISDHDTFGHEWDQAAEFQLDKLDQVLATRKYPQAIHEKAAALLKAEGLCFSDLPELDQARTLEGVARAEREHIKYLIFRQGSLIAPYVPADPLFKQSAVHPAAQHAAMYPGSGAPGLHQGGSGGTLKDRIEQYLGSADCKPNTIKEKRVVLHWFANQLGPKIDVRTITPDHVLEIKAKISSLKVQHTGKPEAAAAKMKIVGKAIHPKTAKKKLDTIKTFMNWLASIGAITNAPGNQLQIKVPKTPNSQKRRPFTSEELGVLFSSPIYTGRHSAAVRHKPGTLILRDDHYWMPLVLLYTGMRLAEPLQVLAADVHVDTDYPYFDLDLAKMDLKQDVSDRRVPIHPDLIAFGFADFVRKRQKEKTKPRLFRGITSQTHVANYYSKVLGRYFTRVGLDDPRLVAHSFRHGFKDGLRNAAVPEGEQKFIMGHSDNEAAHNYGSGSKIEVLWNWVAKADLQIPADVRAKLIVK